MRTILQVVNLAIICLVGWVIYKILSYKLPLGPGPPIGLTGPALRTLAR